MAGLNKFTTEQIDWILSQHERSYLVRTSKEALVWLKALTGNPWFCGPRVARPFRLHRRLDIPIHAEKSGIVRKSVSLRSVRWD